MEFGGLELAQVGVGMVLPLQRRERDTFNPGGGLNRTMICESYTFI